MLIPGVATGARAWRDHVAHEAAAAGLQLRDGVRFEFTLPHGRWVDLDTLAETTAEGLRDAGVLRPRFAGLDALVATKRWGDEPSATVTADAAADLVAGPAPGPAAFQTRSDTVPRPGNRDAKRAWRAELDRSWAARPVLDGDVWADVALGVTGSLLGPLEVVLDALEPVLGRDPRGRTWQEFFPNDDHIIWLRVQRADTAPPLTLTMGKHAG